MSDAPTTNGSQAPAATITPPALPAAKPKPLTRREKRELAAAALAKQQAAGEQPNPPPGSVPPLPAGGPEPMTVAWFDMVIAQNQQGVNNLRAEIEEKTTIMQQTIGMINGFVALRDLARQKESGGG